MWNRFPVIHSKQKSKLNMELRYSWPQTHTCSCVPLQTSIAKGLPSLKIWNEMKMKRNHGWAPQNLSWFWHGGCALRTPVHWLPLIDKLMTNEIDYNTRQRSLGHLQKYDKQPCSSQLLYPHALHAPPSPARTRLCGRRDTWRCSAIEISPVSHILRP